MVEMVTFWSAMRRDSGYFAPWPHQASGYIIGLNCDDQRAHETPLAGSLWLHLRIRYYEGWLTLLKQRLLGSLGIVFDHFLLEMLRGIIIFLCTPF